MPKHSDVVAMYDGSLETLRAFSVDMIAWGRRPRDDAHTGQFEKETMEPHHRAGIRYLGTVGIVTEFRRYMQYCPEWEQTICLTPRGERLRVPWLWDLSHEGNPAYWFCTNAPRYREFLRSQVALAVRGGVDGVHIDDHLGAADTSEFDGCYCDHCVTGFRGYLREHVPAEQLRGARVQDVDALDYRDFVRRWLDAHPNRRASEAPLGSHYRAYQFRATEALMAELRALAEKTAGHPLMFSGNAGLPDPAHLADYRVLTHFTSEVWHGAPGGLDDANVTAVVAYKVAAALNRPLLATVIGQDWAFVKANRRAELVRAWIAQAYAFGQFFMAPHHQWCYTDELGTHWYDGPPEEYGPIYRFIHEHPFLFDDQESAAEMAVLYSGSVGAARRREASAWGAVRELLKAQVPFDMLVAGDDWVPAQLTWEGAARYRKVIVPADLHLDAAQQRVIDRLKEEDKLVVWAGAAALASLPVAPIQTAGADHIWTVPRRRPDGGGTVVHLLNRNYDAARDRVLPVGPVTVRVHRGPCGHEHCTATLYAPGAEAVPLRVRPEGESISAEIPLLPLWAVVHLTPDGAPPP